MKPVEIAAFLMSGNPQLTPAQALDKADELIAEVEKREKAKHEQPQEVV